MIKQIPVGTKLPAPLHKKVKFRCIDEETTIHDVILKLLEDWVASPKTRRRKKSEDSDDE